MDKILYILAGGILGYIIGREYRAKIYTTLEKILKLSIMSEQNLQELLTKVSGLKTSLTNIASDIIRIKEGLPTSGGLSEAEVATLRGELDTAVSQAANLDAENEETPPTE